MPLSIVLAVVAVVVALVVAARRGGAGRGTRFVGTAAAVWIGLVVLAIVVVTVATLIFGR